MDIGGSFRFPRFVFSECLILFVNPAVQIIKDISRKKIYLKTKKIIYSKNTLFFFFFSFSFFMYIGDLFVFFECLICLLIQSVQITKKSLKAKKYKDLFKTQKIKYSQNTKKWKFARTRNTCTTDKHMTSTSFSFGRNGCCLHFFSLIKDAHDKNLS